MEDGGQSVIIKASMAIDNLQLGLCREGNWIITGFVRRREENFWYDSNQSMGWFLGQLILYSPR